MSLTPQSPIRFLYGTQDVKAWMSALPSVGDARPAQCVGCEAPSSIPGQPLGIHGHGVVSRQLWGPAEPGGGPTLGEVQIRRYRCVACHVVMMVGPAGVLRYRRYSAAAIALAFALWGLMLLPEREVRRRVSPWRILGSAAAHRWPSLRRWVAAVSAGRMWPCVQVRPEGSARKLGARIAQALVGRFLQAVLGPITAEVAYTAGAQSR